MKKKILIIATVAILLSLMAYGTLAYFNASATAVNKVTMGNIKVEVVETMLEGEKEVPYVDPDVVMPGAEISKIARVHNMDGSASAWVRAKVECTTPEGTTITLPAGKTLADYITVTYNTTGWTADGEWYYCNAELAKDGSTEPLFTKVTLNGADMGNEFAEKQIIINVVAEAVQSANNGTSVSDAKGWPNS